MNISLTPELEKFVHDKVASGLYFSASEVIREGLRLLAEQDQLREIELEALRQEIRKGMESGPSAPWDVEDLKQKLHAKLAHEGHHKHDTSHTSGRSGHPGDCHIYCPG